MLHATIVIDRDYTIGEIDPRLYGAFLEHVGRAIYGGIYDPGHPESDAAGFRQDVLEAVRELRVPLVRYPGGNFLSGYNWEDGVGPRESRPQRLDLAWRTVETNAVGVNDFAEWAKLAGAEVMMAVNLGTRDVDAARALIEYCNHPGGTHWSDLRISHGVKEPHNFKLWCIGNEMDGHWQIGQRTADDYGLTARETAKVMKLVDPTIELVMCGSSFPGMPSFPEWEATTLDHAYDYVDYISVHSYFNNRDGDLDSFLASTVEVETFIRTVASTCDFIQAKKRSKHRIGISFDEWNVWYHSQPRDAEIQRDMAWSVAPPLLEDRYTMADAIVVGGMLITLLRNADRVRIACIAQLVNAIAPIFAEPGGVWKQTIFHPFEQVSRHGHGESLRVVVNSPSYESKRFGEVPSVDATATRDPESGELAIFALNRSLTEATGVTLDLRGLPPMRVVEHQVLTHPDPHATNSLAHPNAVAPTPGSGARVDGAALTVTMPALSWNMIRLAPIAAN